MSQKEYYNKPEKEWDPCTAMPGVYAYDSPENVKIDMHPMPNKGYPQIPTYEDIYTEPSKVSVQNMYSTLSDKSIFLVKLF